jgi:hypothetical protein
MFLYVVRRLRLKHHPQLSYYYKILNSMYQFVTPTPWAHKADDNNQRYHYERRSYSLYSTWIHAPPTTVSLNVMQPVVFVFQEGVKLFA